MGRPERKIVTLRVPPGATLHRIEIIATDLRKLTGSWFIPCAKGGEGGIGELSAETEITDSIKDILEGWDGGDEQ